MEANFKFYNVGQGCFYGGAITHNHSSFVVVYDCGSVTKGNPLGLAIDEFKKEFDHIDLLIISHFDADHVNGVELLIKNLRVERIIMPYMPLWYRIALIAKTSGGIDSYTSLLLNPTTYFLEGEFNVGNVYYIDQSPNGEGNDNVNPQDDPKFDRELDPNENFGNLNLEEPQEDESSRQKNLDDEPELGGSSVKFLSPNTSLKLEAWLWEFLFYHRQTKNQTDISDFQNAVEDYMTQEGIKDYRELFDLKRRTMIKKLYIDHINKNVNYSSLCMFHSPQFKARFYGHLSDILNSNIIHFIKRPTFFGRRYFRSAGILFTGDQFLKKDADFIPFYNYFKTRLDRTIVFQVPHHGSLNNWKMMPNELNSHNNIRCYVVNCGYGRKKHPDKNVLQNILSNTYCVMLNDEFKMLEYRIFPL